MWLTKARKRKLVRESLQDGPQGSAVRAGSELVKDGRSCWVRERERWV